MEMSPSLKEALEETSALLEEKMDILLPTVTKGKVGENRLAEAVRYSVFSGGKRLRPFLVMTTAGLFSVSKSSALQAAAAIEFIHTYSLIHDDLPALDDDDMRRGRPSCHKQFDEATAILAGDALLTHAFQVVSDPSTHSDNGVRADLVFALSRAVGFKGMVAGQMMDMISLERDMTIEETTRLQRMKTGELFAVSCEAGAILGKASQSLRTAMRGYAQAVGLAFQITDDILDAEAGKTDKRQDKSGDRATYVNAMGLDKAKRQAKMLCDQAVMHLEVFGRSSKVDLLKEMAEFIVHREH